MNGILKFFLGLLAVTALAAAAIGLDWTPGSAVAARNKLQTSAEMALEANGASGASVRMDGQKAILTGAVPDEESREAVIARIAAVEGAGGLLAGGVTAVDASGLTIVPPLPVASPFIFIAEREGDIISFAGHVPDQITRDSIYTLAGELFPDMEISGALDIAAGAPADAQSWLNAATASLRALSYLRNGAAQASDANFVITGEAEDETRANAARTLLDHMPGGVSGSAEISIRKPPSTIEDIINQTQAEEEATAEMHGQAVEASTQIDCAERLHDAINARRIGFSSARADIDLRSRQQLRDIASLLSECPAHIRLFVTGHTDSSGNSVRNQQLSAYRADAVRAFLISVGAPASRITARGLGASEPLVSNATPTGRERNRRIEIEVITER